MNNKLRFQKIIQEKPLLSINQIGTLSEKTLHRVVKRYLEEDAFFHEVKVGNFYADICKDGKITEIQTGNFNKLRDKLNFFLENYQVEIVYPTYAKKWVFWINENTNEISKPRLSPSKGTLIRIMPELYKIKEYLKHPNLFFRIMLIDIEEYRLLNGWSQDKKRGSVKQESIPKDIVSEVEISSPSDYIKLVPLGLTSSFTTRDFSKVAHVSLRVSQIAINIFSFLDVIQKTGKQGRSFVYQFNEKYVEKNQE